MVDGGEGRNAPHFGCGTTIRISASRFGRGSSGMALRSRSADGGAAGLIALNSSTFDLMIVRYLHAQYARLRIDQGVSQSRANGPADRDSGYAFSSPEVSQPRLPENGAQAWRDAVPAQTIQANHIARRD